MGTSDNKLYYLRGIRIPETSEAGKPPAPWTDTQIVGKPLPRVDAYERVSGAAVYPSDIVLPNMLYGAICRSPHANAIVQDINHSEAEKMPGVHVVLTGASPGCQIKWNYQQGSKSKLFERVCRFEGDCVAAVAAETPYQAWDAVKAVNVKYQVLPFVADERKALAPDSPLVHGRSNKAKEEGDQRGDPEKGFSESDVVSERDYRTESQIHTPMELHGCVAMWEGDRLTIWDSTQGVFATQTGIADALSLPLAKVRVIGTYVGGGFGSKLALGKYAVIAALLAQKACRPVKLFLTREETFLETGNRPPANMKLKAGVKRDGTLTALHFSCHATGGAYPAGGIEAVDWLVRDLYTCPNVRTECTDIFINAGPSRPFRAPGHPQCSWALEQMMDELAEKIGMDPVELRLRNIPSYSQGRKGNPPYTSTGLKECLRIGAEKFGWHEALKKSPVKDGNFRTGVGMACCLWIVGGGSPPSTVIVKLFSDGSANLNMGASDIGTGTKTAMAMIISEELGLKPENIQIINADTATTQFATPSGGSKTIPTEGPAVRAAAIRIKQQLLKTASEEMQLDQADLVVKDGKIISTSNPEKAINIKDLEGLKKAGLIMGIGYRGPNPKNRAISPFGAQFCEVRVNIKSGEMEILRFLAAHDSGRVINRLAYDNQVYGGITMGIGFGTTEMRILDQNETGKFCNKNLHDYKVPTALDVPYDMVSIPVEPGDTEANSISAKGLGEPVTIPTAPAIANAVYNATGVRVAETPINPLKLSLLLAGRKE